MRVIVINHSNMSNDEKFSNDRVKRVSVNTIDLPTLSVPEPHSLQSYPAPKSALSSINKNPAIRSHSFHSSNGSKESKFDRTSKRSSIQKQFSHDETDHIVIRKSAGRPVTLKSSFLRKKIKEYEGMFIKYLNYNLKNCF